MNYQFGIVVILFILMVYSLFVKEDKPFESWSEFAKKNLHWEIMKNGKVSL